MSPLLGRFDPDHLEVLRQSTHDLVLRHPLWRPSVPKDAHHTDMGKQRFFAKGQVPSPWFTAQSDLTRGNCSSLTSLPDRPMHSTTRSSHPVLLTPDGPKQPALSLRFEQALRDPSFSAKSDDEFHDDQGEPPASSVLSFDIEVLRKTKDFFTVSVPYQSRSGSFHRKLDKAARIVRHPNVHTRASTPEAPASGRPAGDARPTCVPVPPLLHPPRYPLPRPTSPPPAKGPLNFLSVAKAGPPP